jgi:hypothetical protein
MLWLGTVHLPVKLYSPTRGKELHFHYLYEHDRGRIQNERVWRVAQSVRKQWANCLFAALGCSAKAPGLRGANRGAKFITYSE